MEASFLARHPGLRDGISFVVFVLLVLIGTLLINSFVFRSFNVVGPSMEPTMYTGDRLIVNRLPVTSAKLQNKSYIPDRNQIIVFINPRYVAGSEDEYVVKRVIAFPGERVVVSNGEMRVFNKKHPDGFNPDDGVTHGSPGSPVSGDTDTIVPDGSLFVVGDHREDQYSCDSRGCMGTIPFYDIVGPVGLKIWPLNKLSTY